MHSNSVNPNYEFINKWLNILLPAFHNISKECYRKRTNRCNWRQESIKVSINNLYSFPFIKKAVEDNDLSIHGLIHDIGSGNLKFLNPVTDEFENL